MAPVHSSQVFGTRALGFDSNDESSNKSVFQHVYFIVAIAIALLLVVWRLAILRRNNRPVSEFFSIVPYGARRLPPSQTYNPSYQPGYAAPLTPLPAAYRPDRRVRAADTDAGGRRLGIPEDGDWDAKDALPAYDNVGGPPKYIEAARAHFGSDPPPHEFSSASTTQPEDPPPEGRRQEQSITAEGSTFAASEHPDHDTPAS